MKDNRTRGRGSQEGTEGRRPCAQCRHGWTARARAGGSSGHRFRIRVYGKREEGEGIPLWRLWAWETEVGSGGCDSHGFDILQLVGSFLMGGRGKVTGWAVGAGRGRYMGCSLWKELNQDGSVDEEIDEAGLFLVKNRATRNWNEEGDEWRGWAVRRARWWRGE